MKKLKKILLGIGIGLAALIVITVIVVSFFLGSIVKTGIETVGPKIIQVPIKVDSVRLSVADQLGQNQGLGHRQPGRLQDATGHQRRLDRRQRQSDVSVVGQNCRASPVRVESPEITFEGNPFGGNNLRKIMDNVNAAAASLIRRPQTSRQKPPRRPSRAKNLKWMISSSPAPKFMSAPAGNDAPAADHSPDRFGQEP